MRDPVYWNSIFLSQPTTSYISADDNALAEISFRLRRLMIVCHKPPKKIMRASFTSRIVTLFIP